MEQLQNHLLFNTYMHMSVPVLTISGGCGAAHLLYRASAAQPQTALPAAAPWPAGILSEVTMLRIHLCSLLGVLVEGRRFLRGARYAAAHRVLYSGLAGNEPAGSIPSTSNTTRRRSTRPAAAFPRARRSRAGWFGFGWRWLAAGVRRACDWRQLLCMLCLRLASRWRGWWTSRPVWTLTLAQWDDQEFELLADVFNTAMLHVLGRLLTSGIDSTFLQHSFGMLCATPSGCVLLQCLLRLYAAAWEFAMRCAC